MRTAASLALCLGVVAGPVSAASAAIERSRSGEVEATLSYQPRADYGYRSTLTIRVGDAILHEQPVVGRRCKSRCFPFKYKGPALYVGDMNGDSEREVIVRLFTGGAHCCFIGQVFERSDGRYHLSQRDFGNPAIVVEDVDGNGTIEIKTGDDRFAYAFTSYAGTRFPLQIFKVEHGRFVDRSRAYSPVLRAEARRLWSEYQRWRGRGGDLRGVFAAWAADAARLGRRGKVRRELFRGVERGWLSPVSGQAGGHGFRGKLWRLLGRIGYLRP
jgi:hypothetical protein